MEYTAIERSYEASRVHDSNSDDSFIMYSKRNKNCGGSCPVCTNCRG